jgi:hypothetical protein
MKEDGHKLCGQRVSDECMLHLDWIQEENNGTKAKKNEGEMKPRR